MPNNAQLLSLLRTLLQIAGTYIVAHGTLGINGAMWEQISGAVIMVTPAVWGIFAHTDTAKLKAVEAMPGVAKIVPVPGSNGAVAAALAAADRPKVLPQ